jgi:excisionase family DNA binding protein
MEHILTFDQLPAAVTALTQEVNDLKRLFVERQEQHHPTSQPDDLLTVQQAAEFLHLSVPTVYAQVSRGELPVMKQRKRLYFSREELTAYLREGRRKTSSEIEAETEAYLSNRKKGLNNGK